MCGPKRCLPDVTPSVISGHHPVYALYSNEKHSKFLFLFLQNYTNKSVMDQTLPVAVQFLEQQNKGLVRNLSSYLSLAAIDSATLLAQHVEPILRSVIKGGCRWTLFPSLQLAKNRGRKLFLLVQMHIASYFGGGCSSAAVVICGTYFNISTLFCYIHAMHHGYNLHILHALKKNGCFME